MQVAIGGGDLELLIEQTAQRGRDRGRVAVPHAGVADQHVVSLKLVLVGFDEGHEVLRADFFLAFDQESDVDRQRPRHPLPGAAGFDEGHDLALVVLGAARHDDLATIGMVGHNRLEWRTVPELERIDGLHIIVAVEQHMRTAARDALADDRGMAGGWPHFSGNAEARDVPGKMLGRRLAIGREGRIGGDRLDPQQREQALQAVVELLIDVGEHGLKLRICHWSYSLRSNPKTSGLKMSSQELSAFSAAAALGPAATGGCRMCHARLAASTAVATRLLPQACKTFGNHGSASSMRMPAAPRASQVPRRTFARSSKAARCISTVIGKNSHMK